MSQVTGIKKILTIDDVMERWSVSRATVIQHIDNPEHPLPYISLAGPLRRKGKNRCLLRFRLEAIEAWEAGFEQRTARGEDQPAVAPVGKPAGYSGKIYTRAEVKTSKPTRRTENP